MPSSHTASPSSSSRRCTGRWNWGGGRPGGRGRGGGRPGGPLAHHWQRPKTSFKPTPRQPGRIKKYIY
jgi:hypothetical protein